MRRARPVVLAVVGPPGIGKTALIERLIPALTTRGLAAGVLCATSPKACSERVADRLSRAGAKGVIPLRLPLTSDEQARGPRSALDQLPRNLDLILVDGFAWKRVPRIVLAPTRTTPDPHYLGRGELVWIAHVPPGSEGEPPVFSDALVDCLARELTKRVAGRASAASSGECRV